MGVLVMVAWTVVLAALLMWALRWQHQKGQASTGKAQAAALAAVRRRLERGQAKEDGEGVEGGEEQEEDEQQANDEADEEEKEANVWASASSSIPDSIREMRLKALQNTRPSTAQKTQSATAKPTHRKLGPENQRSRRQTSLSGPPPLSNPYSAGAVETLSRYPFLQDWLDEMQPALQRIKVLAAEPAAEPLPASSASSFPPASSSSSISSSPPPHPTYPLLQRLHRVLANILQYPGAVRYMSFRTDNVLFMELWGGRRKEGGKEGGKGAVAGGGQGGGAGGDEEQDSKEGQWPKTTPLTMEECCRDILFKLGFKEQSEEKDGEGGKEGGEAGDAVGVITLQEVTEAHLEIIIHVLTQLNKVIGLCPLISLSSSPFPLSVSDGGREGREGKIEEGSEEGNVI